MLPLKQKLFESWMLWVLWNQELLKPLWSVLKCDISIWRYINWIIWAVSAGNCMFKVNRHCSTINNVSLLPPPYKHVSTGHRSGTLVENGFIYQPLLFQCLGWIKWFWTSLVFNQKVRYICTFLSRGYNKSFRFKFCLYCTIFLATKFIFDFLGCTALDKTSKLPFGKGLLYSSVNITILLLWKRSLMLPFARTDSKT